MSESLQEKQEYLRQEIMDQGYDGGAFSSFISSIRGEEEVDLDSWTFEDLKSVVAQFKSQYGQNEANQENVKEEGQNDTNEVPQQNQEMQEVQEEKKEVQEKVEIPKNQKKKKKKKMKLLIFPNLIKKKMKTKKTKKCIFIIISTKIILII